MYVSLQQRPQSRLISRYLPAALLLVFVAFPHGWASQSDVLKEFNGSVKEYVALHKKVNQSFPSVEGVADADLIVKNKQEFAKAMRDARLNARQGDIFAPGIQTVFKSLIQQELTGPEGPKARSMVLGEGNPKAPGSTAKIVLQVNMLYPSAAPLSTVPPSLLLRLPKLPEELDYRFIGHHLILRDTKANLIVDFILDAVS